MEAKLSARELCESGWINTFNFGDNYELWAKGDQRILYDVLKERIILTYSF